MIRVIIYMWYASESRSLYELKSSSNSLSFSLHIYICMNAPIGIMGMIYRIVLEGQFKQFKLNMSRSNLKNFSSWTFKGSFGLRGLVGGISSGESLTVLGNQSILLSKHV